jgi:hypothetical protein
LQLQKLSKQLGFNENPSSYGIDIKIGGEWTKDLEEIRDPASDHLVSSEGKKFWDIL